jgi:threonine-phosphate decarboxylase
VAAALGLDPDGVVDLSMSLNPVAPDPTDVVAKHAEAVHRYPDPRAATEALAVALGVEPGRVLLTNGGAEAIALVAAELGRGRVDEPEFSLYRRHLDVVDDDGPRFRSNPHNPTGRLAPETETADVWDEAFYPLATGRWTRGEGIVVGSLTKTFACPGLRVGFVLAPDLHGGADVVERLRRRQPEWAVNGLAVAATPDLLDRADIAAWAAAVASLRTDLVGLLRNHGLEPEPSDACWVLVLAPGLRDRLAPHGIVVRDCTSFGLPDHVRIAVPSADGLARLEEALCRAG